MSFTSIQGFLFGVWETGPWVGFKNTNMDSYSWVGMGENRFLMSAALHKEKRPPILNRIVLLSTTVMVDAIIWHIFFYIFVIQQLIVEEHLYYRPLSSLRH